LCVWVWFLMRCARLARYYNRQFINEEYANICLFYGTWGGNWQAAFEHWLRFPNCPHSSKVASTAYNSSWAVRDHSQVSRSVEYHVVMAHRWGLRKSNAVRGERLQNFSTNPIPLTTCARFPNQ